MNWLVSPPICRVTRNASLSIRATAVVVANNQRYFCFKSRTTGRWTLHTNEERLEADKLKALLVLWKLKQ